MKIIEITTRNVPSKCQAFLRPYPEDDHWIFQKVKIINSNHTLENIDFVTFGAHNKVEKCVRKLCYQNHVSSWRLWDLQNVLKNEKKNRFKGFKFATTQPLLNFSLHKTNKNLFPQILNQVKLLISYSNFPLTCM